LDDLPAQPAAGIAATDLFVVPTIGFKLLYCLVVLAHGRRKFVHHAVTAHPTAEWVARQMTEAFPWDTAVGRKNSVRSFSLVGWDGMLPPP
jgi:hypothetical protein